VRRLCVANYLPGMTCGAGQVQAIENDLGAEQCANHLRKYDRQTQLQSDVL